MIEQLHVMYTGLSGKKVFALSCFLVRLYRISCIIRPDAAKRAKNSLYIKASLNASKKLFFLSCLTFVTLKRNKCTPSTKERVPRFVELITKNKNHFPACWGLKK